jgi:uncharacterized protein
MQLTANEVRVLGSLVEKEATTPDVYPLSLNALTTACNQTSNRDPVMDLSEELVRNAVNNLRQQSLVRAAQHTGSRVMKFQHLLAERLDLDAPLLAALCVLMLRGPQTPGEIRSRAERLASFASVGDAEAALAQLRSKQLVVELPRRPGQKESRWAHLLSGAAAADASDIETENSPVAFVRGSRDPRRESDARIATLEATVAELHDQLEALRADFDALRKQLE